MALLQYKCFVILVMLSDFRREKIDGLHWDDLDFKNKKVIISRSTIYDIQVLMRKYLKLS